MVLNRVGHRSYVTAGITLLSILWETRSGSMTFRKQSRMALPTAAMSFGSNHACHAMGSRCFAVKS